MNTKARVAVLLGGLVTTGLLSAVPASAAVDPGPHPRGAYTETLNSPMRLETGCGAANIRASYGPTDTSNSSHINGVTYRGDRFDVYQQRISSDYLVIWRYGKITRHDGRVVWGWVTADCTMYAP